MISFIKEFNRSRSKYLLLFLLGIDFALIAISVNRFHMDILGNLRDPWSVSFDGGYAEYFQYFKLATMILLLTLLSRLAKSALLSGWALIFAMLLIDDAMSIHENLGSKLSEWFSISPMYYLRSVDYGEMMIYCLLGIITVAILVVANRIDHSLLARQISRGLLLSILGLVCFGGIIDMVHIMFDEALELDRNGMLFFDAIEDGGEMVVISLVLGFVFHSYSRFLRTAN